MFTLFDLAGANDERFSPYCWRAKMALKLKGLEFETQATPFTQIASIGDGIFSSVPVLQDGNNWVTDSFSIALYLEETYPETPCLFGGPGGQSSARFIETFANTGLHPHVAQSVVLDIHDHLTPEDQIYFRQSRETKFFRGKSLEEVQANREVSRQRLQKALTPLRFMLKSQAFIGGDAPLFHDFILYGTLKWPRVISSFPLLEPDDPIETWFARCEESVQ